MAFVPLLGLGQKGKSSTVTSQSHTNLYAEMTPDNEKSAFSFYGTPGLSLFYSFGDTPVRGTLAVGNFIYNIHRGTFWEVNNAGVKVNRGTLTTTAGRVRLAYNGTQIAIVDSSFAGFYLYTIATNAFTTVTANVIGTPVDVTFQDGFGIFAYADGKFQKTAAYAFQTLNALEYATAESNPDGLVRVIADHGELCLFGEQTVEFWINNGAADFPYSNQRGTTLEFGLAAPDSLVKYNDSLCGLFKNKMGQVQVMQMAGHALRKVSPPELDYLINGYAAVSDATAYSYLLGGHPFYQINFPSAGKSWLYDASTSLWSSLESGLSGARHRGEILVDFLNKPRVSDYATGDVYTLDASVYTDNGAAIPREVVMRHLSGNGGRVCVHRLQLDFETGVGVQTGQGDNPQAMLTYSKDNGHTWSGEKWRSIGSIGSYLTRAIWLRLGQAYDWTFKIRITDPVKVVITGVYLESEPRK